MQFVAIGIELGSYFVSIISLNMYTLSYEQEGACGLGENRLENLVGLALVQGVITLVYCDELNTF